MTDFELAAERQSFADDLAYVVNGRLNAAQPIEVLSDHGDKIVQVMQEANGDTFVTRSFTPRAVEYVEDRKLDFTEAWQALHSVFADAGVNVVPSHLLPSSGKYEYVAVSEHITNGQPVSNASTEAKKNLAGSFAKLIVPNRDNYFMHPEMVNDGMFLAVPDETGELKIILVDVDPNVLSHGVYDARSDELLERQILNIADLFWDKWCKPEERREVFVAFFLALNKEIGRVGEEIDLMSRVGTTLQKVHMMSQDRDARQLPMFS